MTIVDLVLAPTPAPAFGSPDHDPVADVWARLARPFDPATAVAALTGLSDGAAALVVATAVAGSPEADRLLDELPRTIRSLATATTTHHERCRGELRGPVLWSETMSARASSFGDSDLYVCVTPSRAYDVAENRVLVAALTAVAEAGRLAVEHTPRADQAALGFRQLRRNGDDARRFVEHPSLQRVTREVPSGRALKRTRAGKKRRTYQPALAMLARVANPLGPAEVSVHCDRRTMAQLRLLTGLLAGLESAGFPVTPLRSVDGHLETGGLAFHHPRRGTAGRAPAGVTAGPLLIDVPDAGDGAGGLGGTDRGRAEGRLTARSGGRQVMLVADDDDLATAVARLVSLRSRARRSRS